MNQQEFEVIKEQLKSGDNDYLKVIFEEHGAYCISNVQRKFNCSLEDAEDLLIDSIINFRNKMLEGKISHLSSIRNYIYSTCVNMKREKDYYSNKRKEKEYEVKLFLYAENEEVYEVREELLQVSINSFQQLAEPCQRILRYFYIYRLSMAEIASKMNFSGANSAKVKKARCYKQWLEITKDLK